MEILLQPVSHLHVVDSTVDVEKLQSAGVILRPVTTSFLIRKYCYQPVSHLHVVDSTVGVEEVRTTARGRCRLHQQFPSLTFSSD